LPTFATTLNREFGRSVSINMIFEGFRPGVEIKRTQTITLLGAPLMNVEFVLTLIPVGLPDFRLCGSGGNQAPDTTLLAALIAIQDEVLDSIRRNSANFLTGVAIAAAVVVAIVAAKPLTLGVAAGIKATSIAKGMTVSAATSVAITHIRNDILNIVNGIIRTFNENFMIR